ncbi:MAG: bifunctional nuclease family protein [Desulfobulbaceae bacterium]|nr:bifunctional nuclease family protein [Candidatus Kapabacteria bacterium]MBS3999691.1 bifunctional nuclease family protein [Desulfobulbaceae bacterium]
MDKVQLVVLGLSASPASNNAYALIMKEVDGERRLPIIIGAFEAQAIALEMEGVIPPRPMTHDLIKAIVDSFDSTLTEVHINDLVDGTFYAKLIFDNDIEIDSRPSDAVALAVRYGIPVFVNADILDMTGVVPQDEELPNHDDDDLKFMKEPDKKTKIQPKSKVEQLQIELDKAIKEENYEKAANLRDELKRLLESS